MVESVREFAIIRRLGEGGMGEVYLAKDRNLGRHVAIKVLPAALTRDPQFIDRFQNEARVQANLVHANIVTLYSFFEEAGLHCIVMEYVEGKSLRDVIAGSGPIPESRALKIFRQIVEAVGFAHRKGIVHRDIKPSNIMIGPDDTAKVMDFGVAKVLGSYAMTRTGAKVGTLCYSSPEQIQSPKSVDWRTDIYSLGITLFEMLTGRLPFDDPDTESEFEIMQAIVNNATPDPRHFYPHISPATADAIFRMTAKERDQRIASCEDCLRAVESLRVDARDTNRPPHPSKPARTEHRAAPDLSGRSQNRRAGWQLLARSGLKRRVCAHPGGVRSLSVSPDGTLLASGGTDRWMRLWSMETGQHLRETRAHEGEVRAVRFSPTGQFLVSAGFDGLVTVWDAAAIRRLARLQAQAGAIYALAFTPDGERLCVGGEDRTLGIWDVERGSVLHVLEGHQLRITCLVHSPTEPLLVSGSTDSTMRIWQPDEGRELTRLEGHRGSILALASSPDGAFLASGGDDKTVRLWELRRAKCIGEFGPIPPPVFALTFSPGGGYLAVGAGNNSITLWDTQTLRCVKDLTGHKGKVRDMTFTSDGGNFVSGSDDADILWW